MADGSSVWVRTMKQAAVVLTLILVLAAAGDRYGAALWRAVARTPEPLLAACGVLGVEPLRATLTGWAQAAVETEIPADVMRRLAWEAMAVLAGPGPGVPGEPVEASGSGAGPDEGAECTLELGGAVYRTFVRQMGVGETRLLFLVCSIDVQHPTSLEARRWRLEESLHTLGRGTERREPVYVTVRCRLPGVQSAVESEEAGRKVLARLRARKASELGGESWYTVLAHTPFIGPAIPVAGRDVNLSLVFRPDAEAGCTWVIIGTPLCAGDY